MIVLAMFHPKPCFACRYLNAIMLSRVTAVKDRLTHTACRALFSSQPQVGPTPKITKLLIDGKVGRGGTGATLALGIVTQCFGLLLLVAIILSLFLLLLGGGGGVVVVYSCILVRFRVALLELCGL